MEEGEWLLWYFMNKFLIIYVCVVELRKLHDLSLKTDSIRASSMERYQLSLHMNDGNKEQSYANNSSMQVLSLSS